MTRHEHTAARRPGFTLVELLVVIAIIGVLASLSAAAYFKLIGTKQRDTTEDTIRVVYKVLEQQMRVVAAQADKETMPPSVINLAGGDVKRARVIWKKLRERQEFPTSFAEALAPWKAAINATYNLPAADLPAKPFYVKALAGGVTGPGDSSACLLLAIQQNRKGIVLAPDALPSSAIADTNGDGIKEIVDAWGTPLAFFRWPTSLTNGPANPSPGTLRGARFADPMDPDGLLLNPAWFASNSAKYEEVVYPAPQVTYCRGAKIPLSAYSDASGNLYSFYSVPVLISAGQDNAFGLAANLDVVTAAQAKDNIYSYQLKLGAAGIAP